MRRLALGLALALALALALWLLIPPSYDDRSRLASKRRYLEGLPASEGPSVVVILFDDLGYGDLGAYGARSIRTPHLDRLAAEGARFTHGYASSPYCSASRAGLLTGRYPVRSGLDHVLQAPGDWRDWLLRLGRRHRRLPAHEITLAEALSAAGYATAIFGKWHLGDFSPALPNDLGFDEFYGLLHSNDQGRPVVWENRRIVEEHPIDQTTLTRRYTERAVDFIARQAGRPFLLYLPHTFPHVPLHVSGERLGTSPGGLYGDVVEELDDSVGRVVAALERAGIASRTVVFVTSDNGPWFQGSPHRLRGRKMDVFEGGQRVPLIVWAPGRIAPGASVEEPVIGVDLLPTVLDWAGLEPPLDREIDGVSLAGLLEQAARLERDEILFFQLGRLRAIRSGRFKLHLRRRVPYGNPMGWFLAPEVPRGPWLFDLSLDPDESYDVSARHPEVAARLTRRLDEWARDFRVNPQGWR